MANIFAPFRPVFFAAAAIAVVLTAPIGAQAKDAATAAIATASQATAARAEFAAPKIKRARKSAARSSMRQVAAVEALRSPQCFLFWCGRPVAPWLVLGVAY